MAESRAFKAGMLASGRFLVTVTSLLSAAILSRLFTKIDYAAYRQTTLVFNFVYPLLSLGLPLSLYYFIPRHRDRSRSILTGNLVLLFSMGCLFAIVMWGGGNEFLAKKWDQPALRRLLLIYSPYAFLVLPVTAIYACLVSYNRVKTLVIYNVASKIVFFVCAIGLVLIWRTPEAAISGMVIAEFLVFFPAMFLMYRVTTGGDCFPTAANMWAQMKYSVPLGVAATLGTITLQLDKVIVSSMCPPEQFAIYANGAIEIPLMGVITGSVMSVLLPEFSEMYQREEHSEIKFLWHRAMVKCALLIFPIMIFLFVLAPEVIRVLFSAEYAESVYPFRVYLLALPIRVTQFSAIIMAAGRNRLIVSCSAAELVINLFLSIILVKILGSTGAAVATVLVLYLWSVPYNLYYISKILKVNVKGTMCFGVLAKVFVISTSAGLVFLLAPIVRPLGDVVTLAVFGSFYTIAIFVLFDYFRFIKAKEVVYSIKNKLKHGEIKNG